MRSAIVATVGAAVLLAGSPVATAAPADWTIVAHRGGIVATPENTFAAYSYALLRGVDAVEVDIRFTRDHKPVVMHDAMLNRTTDCRGPVSEISRKRLRRCDAGRWFGREFIGEAVPTLARTFNFISRRSDRTVFFLHLKTGSRRDARKVYRLARNKGLLDRTIPISGSPSALRKLKRAGFDQVGYVFNRPAGWRSGYDVLIPYNLTINDYVVRRAHERGQVVFPVENHPHSVGALAGTDIDGVLANHIDKSLILAGRLVPPPDQAVDEPGEPEPTTIPAGESRRTGPMDF